MSEYTSKVLDANGNSLSGLSAWKQQLITKEDPMHIHKTLGVLCLISIIFRLIQIGPSDMGFATSPSLTMPTVFLHLLLNITSFLFTIPSRRISSGYRIWPEYRLHSLVFLCRSLAVMVVYWYEQTFHKEPNYDANLAIIIVGLVAADLSSYSQRQYSSRSIRELDTAEWVKFLFSVAQFCGTANILIGIRYRYSFHMMSVIVVQCNAFLMTVRRKNLAGQTLLVSLYGFLLISSLVMCAYEYFRVDRRLVLTAITIVHVTVVQRMAPVWPSIIQPLVSNKYMVWLTVGLILRQARPWIETTATLRDCRVLFFTTFVPMWTLGWYKCFGQVAKKSVTKKVE